MLKHQSRYGEAASLDGPRKGVDFSHFQADARWHQIPSGALASVWGLHESGRFCPNVVTLTLATSMAARECLFPEQ